MKKLILLIIIVLYISCSDKDEVTVSLEGYVKTLSVADITTTSATCKGNVQILQDNNMLPIEESGICYARTNNPTIGDNKKVGERIVRNGGMAIITKNPKTGEYTADLKALQPNTTYYVRAYTKTSTRLFYGNEISFQTKDVTGEKDYIELTTTGIAVQKTDITSSYITWISAKELCENSTVGGYKDWRMPTLSELSAIYNNRNSIGSFKATRASYWSSTSAGLNYYQINFDNGYTEASAPNAIFSIHADYYCRCVRTLP